MNKKAYIGYVPKKANVQKLQQYVQGNTQRESIPSPVKLKKNK